MMSAFSNLATFHKDTVALEHIAGRLGWDQETMMPSGSIGDRVEEFAALEKILHARRSSSELGTLLERAEAEDLPANELRQVQLIRRTFERTKKVPEDLAIALARLTPKAHKIWVEAREKDDFAIFKPVLAEVVMLTRDLGAALAEGGNGSPYDALLQEYEPDGSSEAISEMFRGLRPHLVDLRSEVLDRSPPPALNHSFEAEKQMQIAHILAERFGYDFTRGRIDKAVHPFSSGSSSDVRITTRTNERDPMNCFYSTIHEVGHASYEQNIDPSYAFSAFGKGCSMGIHESQSRIYENQLGRSRGFTSFLYRQMKDAYGDFGVSEEDTFYKIVNRVSDGYIRTEADELQYNLHIMLRYDLERALVAGDLIVEDLEAAWNDRFEADFGYQVDRASHGVLQDVHWSEALFGYFPTYSLGNVYAGCLYEKMTEDVPNLESDLEKGDLSRATSWLKDALQQHGSRYPARELMSRACGKEPSVGPLVNYIKRKFSDIYDL